MTLLAVLDRSSVPEVDDAETILAALAGDGCIASMIRNKTPSKQEITEIGARFTLLSKHFRAFPDGWYFDNFTCLTPKLCRVEIFSADCKTCLLVNGYERTMQTLNTPSAMAFIMRWRYPDLTSRSRPHPHIDQGRKLALL